MAQSGKRNITQASCREERPMNPRFLLPMSEAQNLSRTSISAQVGVKLLLLPSQTDSLHSTLLSSVLILTRFPPTSSPLADHNFIPCQYQRLTSVRAYRTMSFHSFHSEISSCYLFSLQSFVDQPTQSIRFS